MLHEAVHAFLHDTVERARIIAESVVRGKRKTVDCMHVVQAMREAGVPESVCSAAEDAAKCEEGAASTKVSLHALNPTDRIGQVLGTALMRAPAPCFPGRPRRRRRSEDCRPSSLRLRRLRWPKSRATSWPSRGEP